MTGVPRMAVITHSAFVLKKCALMTKRDHPLPFASQESYAGLFGRIRS